MSRADRREGPGGIRQSSGEARNQVALILSAAAPADHTGLEKVLRAADLTVVFCSTAILEPDIADLQPSVVVVDLRASIPNTTGLLNALSSRASIPQTVFWGTGPTDVGVVEFDQTVKLNWLNAAWHLDTLHQLEARLRTRGRPKVAVDAAEIAAGLQAGQLELHYQPSLDLSNGGAPSPVEALLRWRHETFGLLTAADFMPGVADQILRRELTDFALLSAVQQLQLWERTGIEVPIAVNLEASLLNDVTFPKRLARLVREHEVQASRLHLEVSEHGVMTGTPETGSIIEALVESDFWISLDDFGRAQISIHQVLLLPFAEVKISAVLVHALARSERARRLTRGLIHLAHDLDMVACGKGVETSEQILLLKAIGCDSAQGWYIGGAVPPSALVALRKTDTSVGREHAGQT